MTASGNSRKLQSIYNALDTCNYSLAVKLCEMKDMERWGFVHYYTILDNNSLQPLNSMRI